MLDKAPPHQVMAGLQEGQTRGELIITGSSVVFSGKV
jgi:hypothetical protein